MSDIENRKLDPDEMFAALSKKISDSGMDMDMGRIEAAYHMAKLAHTGQLRKRVSFVTPSTIFATGSPNCFAISLWVRSVSSITSCRSAAMMESSSRPMSTEISAAAMQCVT